MEPAKRNIFGTEVLGGKSVMYSMYVIALILGILVWFNFQKSTTTEKTTLSSFRIQHDLGWIRYLDEGLTMSAYMYASTGDKYWSNRYNQLVTRLTDILNEAEKTMPKQAYEDFLLKIKLANDSLVNMEKQSLVLVSSGKLEEAKSILFGSHYLVQKELYNEGLSGLSSDLDLILPKRFDQMKNLNLLIFIVGVILLLGIVFVAFRTNKVLKHIKHDLAGEYKRYVKKLIAQREELKLTIQQVDLDREKLTFVQDDLLKSKEALRKSLQDQSKMNKDILDSQIQIKEVGGEEGLLLSSSSMDGPGIGLLFFDDKLDIVQFGGRLIKEIWPKRTNIAKNNLLDLIPFLDSNEVSKWKSNACFTIDVNGVRYPIRFKRFSSGERQMNALEFFDFDFELIEKASIGNKQH